MHQCILDYMANSRHNLEYTFDYANYLNYNKYNVYMK
jgi:hypothetical protein